MLGTRGLPPQFWFEDTFRSIADIWGNLVKIEDRTCTLKDFRVAKVLISTNRMEKFKEKVTIVVENIEVDVYVSE